MRYTLLPPPAALQPYVQYCWTLEESFTSTTAKTFTPLADGCPGLVFQSTGIGTYHDEKGKSLPDIFLYGQTIQPRTLTLEGRLQTMGMVFFPHALTAIFGIHSGELREDCTDLHALAGNTRLTEQLAEAVCFDAQLQVLGRYLQTAINASKYGTDAGMLHAVNHIREQNGNCSLKTLQQQLHITPRSLERRFTRQVGIPPKLFANVCRFQSSLQQMRNSDNKSLTDIALDNGYADQSHFIRHFKSFAGHSPNQYRKCMQEAADNFPMVK